MTYPAAYAFVQDAAKGAEQVEQNFGPFDGYYVAVYLCEIGELGHQFLAYYKIVRRPSASYWDADYVRKGSVAGSFDSRQDAEEMAVQLARLHIGNLRSAKREDSKQSASRAPHDLSWPHQYTPTTPTPL